MSRTLAAFSYDLGGHRLKVTSSSEELRNHFDRDFGQLRSAANGPQGFMLDLVEGALPEPPASLRLVFEGPLRTEGCCRFFASEQESFLLLPGCCTLEIDRHESRGRITIAPGHAERIHGAVGIAAVEAAADDAGQAMLHAAALTLPDDRRCVLIHAPSGTGKTTTALALVHAGYGLCSDDAVFVGAESIGFSAWGFPSDLKVHRNTLSLMPWLAPFLADGWDNEGEQPLSRTALASLGRVEDYEPCPVAGLFRLSRASGEETEIAPVRRADVLASLAADNVRTGLTGLVPLQKRRFDMLARLTAAVPVHEIRAGRNLTGLGDAIRSKLG
jgi:hypothetical protein